MNQGSPKQVSQTSTRTSSPPPQIKETPLSWLVWLLGCLFYFYEFLLQVSPGVMAPELCSAFNIEAQGLGLLGGVYFYSYAGMQIPAGVLLDRLGPHRLITFATLICALSTLAFAHTDNFTMALIARFCIGFGSAFAAVGTMKFAANWFPAKRFALLTGLMVAIGMAGAIGGEQPLAKFINAVGWRASLTWLGLIGLLLAATIYFVGKDSPAGSTPINPDSKTLAAELKAVFISLKKVAKNQQLWLVATYGGLVFMATPVFCGLWGVPFLEANYGMPREEAAYYTSLIFVGWIVGSPSWGLISDYLNRRKPPMVIGTLGAFLFMSLMLYSPVQDPGFLKAYMFLFGLFSAGFLPAFSIAKEISCQKNCATALSFMNMMNMAGVALAQPLIGVVLDKLWVSAHQTTTTTTLTTVGRHYPPEYYVYAVSILPLGLFIAICLLPFIKETYCHTSLDNE